jgi:hypothetical protein
MFVYFVIKTSMSWRLKSASYTGTRRDQAGLEIAPQGNQQLTCHRHDGDPPNATLGGPDDALEMARRQPSRAAGDC